MEILDMSPPEKAGCAKRIMITAICFDILLVMLIPLLVRSILTATTEDRFMQNVLGRQFEAVKEGEYERAYGYFSEGLKKKYSLREYRAFLNRNKEIRESNDIYLGISTSEKSGEGEISGGSYILMNDNIEREMDAGFVKEKFMGKSVWRISRINITTRQKDGKISRATIG